MVSYQKWTSLVFEQVPKSVRQDSATDIVSVGADVWNDRKEELRTATIAEARQIAQQEIEVTA